MSPRLFLLLLLIALCIPASAQTQTNPNSRNSSQNPVANRTQKPSPAPQPGPQSEPETVPDPALPAAEQPKLTVLESVHNSLQINREEIAELNQQLQNTEIDKEREDINARIEELYEENLGYEDQIRELALGFDLEAQEADAVQANSIDFTAQLSELLQPLVVEMRDWTEKPREIEEIRLAIENSEERIERIKRALTSLSDRIQNTAPGELRDHLQAIYNRTEKDLSREQANLSIAESQLAELKDNSEGVFTSIGTSLSEFIRSRGVTLFLGLFSFVLIVAGLEWLRIKLHRWSPFHNKRHRSFATRVIEIIYHVFTVLSAFIVVLGIFYFANDWLLLGFSIILLIGLVFTARNSLPKAYEQIRLLLNIGQVREGERVIYNGVPYLVAELHLFSTLENPRLKNGIVRLDIKHMMELVSRPLLEEEPWFPCEEGDWIEFTDGTRGRVVVQTPESVRLVKLGGARINMTTADFLSSTTLNLSQGFRIVVTFGIDYAHQAISTTKVPQIMWSHITRGLGEMVDKEQLKSLKVEFQSAGASSLDYAIIADFVGALAPRYEVLNRALQSLAVECCNKHDWTIPFAQLTIHQAPPPALAPAANPSSELAPSAKKTPAKKKNLP